MNFETFARLPFEQFSAENSKTWLGCFSFSSISVKMFRFSIYNQYKKLVPVLSRFCNGLLLGIFGQCTARIYTNQCFRHFRSDRNWYKTIYKNEIWTSINSYFHLSVVTGRFFSFPPLVVPYRKLLTEYFFSLF